MKGKVAGWMVFLLCLALLSLAATPYSRAVDHALMAARFAIIVVLSVLVVHEWRNRNQAPGQPSSQPDVAESFLAQCRRWYYGDQ